MDKKRSAALSTSSVQAKSCNLRVSPRKINLLAQMIRGLPVQKALNALMSSKKRVAVDVRKALLSAVANAENNHGLDVDALVVSEAFVGKSITLKRFIPRAKGRGNRLNKPFSNLTIVLREYEVA